jgi:hypothetical protein
LAKPNEANAATWRNSSSAFSSLIPGWRSAPSTNRAWSFSISRDERHVPIARRKPSLSAAENPATSIAIRMTCSW